MTYPPPRLPRSKTRFDVEDEISLQSSSNFDLAGVVGRNVGYLGLSLITTSSPSITNVSEASV